MNRSAVRENAFKLLYSSEIQKEFEEEQIDIFLEDNNIIGNEETKYIKSSFFGIRENITEIENLISKNLSKKWTIERISRIDIAILKLAIYEIVYSKLPYKVVINEAVELAKKYGEDKKIAIRNIRRDALEDGKKNKDSISEDELKDFNDRIQKLTDNYISKVDEMVKKKEDDLMTV